VVEFMMLLLSKNEADCLTYQHKQRCASVNYPQALNRSANYRASGLVQGSKARSRVSRKQPF
ncbi:MAG: hypothetical protein Q8K74_12455, partial [Candidatus Nitrotoga sp.]|nr:hypothetical protein [Candidatus Nitrotoga sp.]MDP1856827.1 hypothetical protein [Candidatus Nitrotoga sp.]